MIDIAAIKNRISELAIHGELVEHSGTLTDVEKIVVSVKSDRDSLIKEGLSKKSKVATMIEEDTFDVPDNWKWVALGELCIFLSRGKSPKYSETEKYPVFAQKCNQPDGLELWKARFLDERTLDKWQEYFRLQDKDIVINSTGTGTMGRVGYYLQESLNPLYPFMLPDSHVTVARLGEGIISKYVYFALRSPTIQMIMEKQFRGSTNQKEFYIDSVYAMPIPLPPTCEQKCIVEKIEEIFEILDKIDTLQEQYASNQEALKSKLIDAAIQGQLTEQLPEDGTAEELYQQIQGEKKKLEKEGKIKKEKKVPAINEDELPFEIPLTWKWVRLSEIGLLQTGTTPSKSNPNYFGDYIPFLSPGEIQDNVITRYDKQGLSESGAAVARVVEKASVLQVCIGGSIGKTAINDRAITFNQQINSVTPYIINHEYIFYCLTSNYFISRIVMESAGAATPIINKTNWGNLVIPLAPLAEQDRIVEKLNSLFVNLSE